jgi:transmembrane protein EpsG
MLTTSIVGAVAVLLAALARFKGSRWGLGAAFGVICLFLALRYDFGNDYGVYESTFSEIAACAQPSDFANPIQLEQGWVYLNWLFRPLGFFGMTAVIAVALTLVYYKLIALYVPRNLYWFAVFLYVFSPSFMLVQSTAMRQSLAIMFFVVSTHFILRRSIWRYTLCIALASAFHFTAIVLWPVYFLGSPRLRLGAAARMSMIGVFVSLVFLGDTIGPLARELIGSYFPRYDVYQDAGATRTGLGFLFMGAMLAVLLLFEARQHGGRALQFRIAAVGLMLAPISLVIEMLSRLGLYMLPATMVAYPLVVKSLREPMARGAFVSAVSAYTVYLFVQFFYSVTYEPYFGHYHTILSAAQWH